MLRVGSGVAATGRNAEKERMGAKEDLFEQADALLTQCIDGDKQVPRVHFHAYKLRALLKMEEGTYEHGAAEDYWEYVKCLCANKKALAGDVLLLSKELDVVCKLFYKLKEFKQVGRVATLALSTVVPAENKELVGHWKYYLAASEFKTGNKEEALALGLEGLNLVTNETDKARLESLITKCESSLSTPLAPAALVQPRPLMVPVLQLSNLNRNNMRRRKTISEAAPPQGMTVSASSALLLHSSGSATASPVRARKAKSGRSSSSLVSKSTPEVAPVFASAPVSSTSSSPSPPPTVAPQPPAPARVPTPPPIPPPYAGELPSPPRLEPSVLIKSTEKPTLRELELMARVEQLTKELAEARTEIERLKGGN